MNKKQILASLFLGMYLTTSAIAQNISNAEKEQYRQRLFSTLPGHPPYRIPAIASCSDGTLLGVSDYRYCGSDIGYGAVDIHYRMSKDFGKTWGEEKVLADGHGNDNAISWDYAFGDCAIAADRHSSNVMFIAVGGKVTYFQATRNNPNPVTLFRSNDNGKTWNKGENLTDQIYELFDKRKGGPIQSLFFSSGKITQSRYIKVGKYYRLYAALPTRPAGNYVLYSDDFGSTWNVLGSVDLSCCPQGDEAKCEELPDGRVIISSRTSGRWFNIFTYINKKKAVGYWGVPALANTYKIKNECNGEILMVKAKRKADGKKTWVALQSVPFGPQRTRVGFFYKEIINKGKNETPQTLAKNWKQGKQVAEKLSGYSTMILQKDGRIGFLWEEGPEIYNIDYTSLSIADITQGEFY